MPLADRIRAQPTPAAAGRRPRGNVRLGDGGHLPGERGVDVDTVRPRAAGRVLLLPPVPPARPGPGPPRVGAGRLRHRVVIRTRACPGRGRARGRRAAGDRRRVPRCRRVRSARDHGDPGLALPAGTGRREPRAQLGGPHDTAGISHTPGRPRPPRGTPPPAPPPPPPPAGRPPAPPAPRGPPSLRPPR